MLWGSWSLSSLSDGSVVFRGYLAHVACTAVGNHLSKGAVDGEEVQDQQASPESAAAGCLKRKPETGPSWDRCLGTVRVC